MTRNNITSISWDRWRNSHFSTICPLGHKKFTFEYDLLSCALYVNADVSKQPESRTSLECQWRILYRSSLLTYTDYTVQTADSEWNTYDSYLITIIGVMAMNGVVSIALSLGTFNITITKLRQNKVEAEVASRDE